MAKAFGLPSLYDPSIEEDEFELQRRQQLAEALRAQSLQSRGTQMAGNIAIKQSPLEPISKILIAALAGKMDKDSAEGRQNLAEKRANAMKAMSEGYANSAFPTQTMPAGAQSDPRAAQQRNMLIQALRMGDQDTAKLIMKDRFERTPEMKNMEAKGIDPREMGSAELAKLKREGERVMSPDQVLLGQDNKPAFTAPSAPSSQGKMMADLLRGGGIDANSPEGQAAYRQMIAKETSHPGLQSITTVNAYTPASEEAQRDFMKSTRTRYDALHAAPVALQNIEKAKALIPAARGFMGPGGESLLEAAKFLNNRLGTEIKTEGVKSAEELRTRIFFNVMDNLKKMDAQPSQLQQKIMMESLGKLGNDPNAMPAILDAFADSIRGKVELHNREVAGAIKQGVKFPYDPTINLAPSGASLVDDLVRKYAR